MKLLAYQIYFNKIVRILNSFFIVHELIKNLKNNHELGYIEYIKSKIILIEPE